MPSLLVPSHPSRVPPIVPKSFAHPSQTDSSPPLSPPLPFITSAAATSAAAPSSALPAAATSAAAPSAALPADATSAATHSADLPADAISAAVPQAISEATRPSVPPGFMPRARGPLVPPGFGAHRPNIHPTAALNRPSLPGNGNAASSSAMTGQAYEAVTQAIMGQLRILSTGFDKMQKEVEEMKRRSGCQGGLITGLKEEERAFEESKKAIGSLEDNVVLLITHAQEKEQAISELEDKVGTVEGQNRELRKDVGDLEEEIGGFRRMFKKVCVGVSIVGGVVLVGGVVAWVRKN